MSECAPISMYRRFGADKKEVFMLTTVAQWSHNTLIVAFALLTALVVFSI
jgi:hypothetical protein